MDHQASIQSCLYHNLPTALSVQEYVCPTFVKVSCYLFVSLTQKQLTQEMMKYQPIIQIFFQTFHYYVLLFQSRVNPVNQQLWREMKQLTIIFLSGQVLSAMPCFTSFFSLISCFILLSTSTSFFLLGYFLKKLEVKCQLVLPNNTRLISHVWAKF